ncbi:MAG: hypothetical protein C0523_05195 [Cytophaga sp.]|nr:hypothetical protein [Cytophaga sp.]
MVFYRLTRLCDRIGLRWLARIIVFFIYTAKGQRIKSVRFNSALGLWEYRIGTSFFLTQYPSWFSNDEYYLQVLKKYSGHYYLPEPGDFVLDIGAGVGEEVLPLSQLVGASGKVFAFEANPRTFQVLDYVCKQNNLTNTRTFNLAISGTSGSVFIDDDGGYGVQNSISEGGEGTKFKVNSISIDDFMAGQSIEHIDLLKANIEGAEQFLVEGMSNSISRIKRIAISCHDFRYESGESEFYKTYDKVFAFFQHHFYLTRQQTGDAVRDYYLYGVNKNCGVNKAE